MAGLVISVFNQCNVLTNSRQRLRKPTRTDQISKEIPTFCTPEPAHEPRYSDIYRGLFFLSLLLPLLLPSVTGARHYHHLLIVASGRPAVDILKFYHGFLDIRICWYLWVQDHEQTIGVLLPWTQRLPGRKNRFPIVVGLATVARQQLNGWQLLGGPDRLSAWAPGRLDAWVPEFLSVLERSGAEAVGRGRGGFEGRGLHELRVEDRKGVERCEG
ncbi:hypothetical protein QBC34DRAFT_412623 [Podospora aff. communis PSN243]|uniref:Uncharacterized protein n=1 Tax=Podospora aff. communis PSN243 TaxID=3040156 RepID=A0AAV9GC88_9PEZI|nr:hypothetical protein QBC34DRAFT_412623 [Podospora aff. communis PSN243]